MTLAEKKALLQNRRNILAANGKENAGVIRKLDRQLRNMSK